MKINLPEVKLIAGGKAVSAEQARELATQPVILTYEYNGAVWAIAVDPNAIKSKDEETIQAIQLELSNVNSLSPDDLAKVQAMPEEEREAYVTKLTNSADVPTMLAGMKKLRDAECEMYAKAVVGCNDPIHEPTAENLKNGGIVAKRQYEALDNWWNPTAPESQAEASKTEAAKS